MIIQKGGRLIGKTAQMKLESFDTLLDAYMELVEEKKKQDPNYVPKIVYVGMKYTKPKPRTNFDRITESVEALAEFLSKYIDCDTCFKDERLCGVSCKNEIIEWLNKEVNNE